MGLKMKRSGFKRKEPETDAQRQLREAHREAKRALGSLGRNRSRSGARGSYYNDEWIPSQWELECRKMMHWREKAGEVSNLRKEVITFKLLREDGLEKVLQIEVDLCFFHNGLKRECRWDAKPPRVQHTKWGRRYPWSLHREWLLKWELLQFAQPEYDYRILEKGNCYAGIDI